MHAPRPPISTGIRRLRIGRRSIAGHVYHITSVTQRRLPVFSDLFLGRVLVQAMIDIENAGIASTIAYVVMPDHLHWLMQLHDRKSLSQCMCRLKSVSSRVIKQSTPIDGKLWQSGYFDSAIRRTEDLVALSRYIVANPLRVGIVSRIGDYSLWDAIWLDHARCRANSRLQLG